jgi:ParB family chromosome partitioning protein
MSTKKVVYIDPANIHIVGLDDGHDDTGANIDPLYDERIALDLDENFVRNIMVYGINSPVLCRDEAGRTVVVDGRQRVRAAREANRRFNQAGEVQLKVPVIIVNGSDRRVQGIMISANEQRQDDTVMVKAKKAVRMLDLTGSKDEVCVAFGKTAQTINSWIRLVNAVTEIHEAVEAGTISATAAIELAGLPRDEQVEALNRAVTDTGSRADGSKKTASAAKARKARNGSGQRTYLKKGWLKKAMKTSAFDDLKPRERDVINWIVSGEAPKNSWMDTFVFNAECEIEEKSEPKTKVPEDADTDTDTDTEVAPTDDNDTEMGF